MSTVFKTKQGSYHRRCRLSLSSLDASTAIGVTFTMSRENGEQVFAAQPGNVDSASQVSYQFTGTQLDTPGVYKLEASLTFADGPEVVPTEGTVTVIIEPKL